jgi:hypothetical protein
LHCISGNSWMIIAVAYGTYPIEGLSDHRDWIIFLI